MGTPTFLGLDFGICRGQMNHGDTCNILYTGGIYFYSNLRASKTTCTQITKLCNILSTQKASCSVSLTEKCTLQEFVLVYSDFYHQDHYLPSSAIFVNNNVENRYICSNRNKHENINSHPKYGYVFMCGLWPLYVYSNIQKEMPWLMFFFFFFTNKQSCMLSKANPFFKLWSKEISYEQKNINMFICHFKHLLKKQCRFPVISSFTEACYHSSILRKERQLKVTASTLGKIDQTRLTSLTVW